MRAESLQPLILWACPIRSLAVTNHTVSIGNLDTIRYKESNLTDSFIPILKGFLKTWGSLLIIPFIAQRILIWQKSILQPFLQMAVAEGMSFMQKWNMP